MSSNEALTTEDLFSWSPEKNVSHDEVRVHGEEKVLPLLERGEVCENPHFHLKTEAFVLELAYAYNKILSLSNSRTRILAHQVESTHQIVNALNYRFLIADEVGLGKTIEAGLVIKELCYRYGYEKILIVCPASLQMQWQHEMQNKFNENFSIIDRRELTRLERMAAGEGKENPWEYAQKSICSMDFIKNENFRENLQHVRWDAVIVDEAHRLRRDGNKTTRAYAVAEVLAKNSKALLFLSATPFRGKIEELYFLIRLLDKNLLGPYNSFYNRYCVPEADLSDLKEKLSSIVIRRTKKDVGGFTGRMAKTIRFELYPGERALYDATTDYVVTEFNRALQCENRAVGFVMTVFQKLLDSSSFALLSALKKRAIHIQTMIDRMLSGDYHLDGNKRLEMNEPELLDVPDEIPEEMSDVTMQKTLEEFQEELATIKRLVNLAGTIEKNKKGEKLRSLVKSLKKRGEKKFLVFTQFRTTQDYLCQLLSDYSVEVFHGSMNRDEKENAILRFKDDTEILICTEAGGEGRNMQFCNILINYDLPWSPLKIEQRIGRVHRFGQTRDVTIYNFSTKDTVAERVLEVLATKLRLFEESLGAPDVILGDMEDEAKLNSIFMEFAGGRKKQAHVEKELDSYLDNARKSYEKLSDLTVTRHMDFNYDEYYRITLREREFSNNRIERFVSQAQSCGSEKPGINDMLGKKHPVNGLYPVKCYPDGTAVTRRYGTFDSELALENENLDFLAFGHPVVDYCISSWRSDTRYGLTGIKVIPHQFALQGVIFNFLVKYRGAEETSELLPVFVPFGKDIQSTQREEIEETFIDHPGLKEIQGGDVKAAQELLPGYVHDLYQKAKDILEEKLAVRIHDMKDTLDLRVDPEIEKIHESFDREIAELEEKLEWQRCQMKWYDRDMRSAITRTSNKIESQKKEKASLLNRYRRYCNIQVSRYLVNGGVLICIPRQDV
ncbi:MAG: DEAD/DEAH box helicase [Spirochaetota bacterium]